MGRLLGTRATRGARLAPWVRVGAALVFVVFGVGKFTAHATELSSFRGYGLPSPDTFVYAIGLLELIAGLMLGVGALTRLAAIVLAGDMAGAIVVAGFGHGEVVPSLTLAPALLAAMLFLLVVGPGGLALDTQIAARTAPQQGEPCRFNERMFRQNDKAST
jgi:putative oxidoreductase